MQKLKKICISTTVLALTSCGGGSGGTTSSNAQAPKKTGQTTSYYAKDDGDYQKVSRLTIHEIIHQR